MNSLVSRLVKNRPFADQVLCHFLRRRMRLPQLSLASLFDDFDREPVTIRQVPRGCWSTPLVDVIMLLKLTACAHPKRILEIGSFRGYTALLIAQHSDADARIVTVDRYPEHGEAYRNTPFATKIERRVGEMGGAMFAGDKPQSYDLIFVDADHLYAGVKKDSELVLPLVSPSGYVLWHDYTNWGYFNGENGVPEYLGELAATGLPVAHISGTNLAIHSPAWGLNGASRSSYEKATREFAAQTGVVPWESNEVRG
jgi:predicted O-methyltransferase YrrM